MSSRATLRVALAGATAILLGVLALGSRGESTSGVTEAGALGEPSLTATTAQDETAGSPDATACNAIQAKLSVEARRDRLDRVELARRAKDDPNDEVVASLSLTDERPVEDVLAAVDGTKLKHLLAGYHGFVGETTFWTEFDLDAQGLTVDEALASWRAHLADSAEAMRENVERHPDHYSKDDRERIAKLGRRIGAGEIPVASVTFAAPAERAQRLANELRASHVNVGSDADAPVPEDAATNRTRVAACGEEEK